MSGALLTVDGYTAEPRRRTTQSGDEVVTVAVGHTPRRKNRDSGQWEDAGPTTWVEADFWKGEADQLAKGSHVVLSGEPSVNLFTGKDGQARGTVKLRYPRLSIVQEPTRGEAGRRQGAPQTSSSGGWATSPVPDAQTAAQGLWATPESTNPDTPF